MEIREPLPPSVLRGEFHGLALTASGQVLCWGQDQGPEVGLDATKKGCLEIFLGKMVTVKCIYKFEDVHEDHGIVDMFFLFCFWFKGRK